MNAINPAVTKLYTDKPTLDAWIMAPEYTGLSPLLIATPAGLRHTAKELTVPEGSTLSIHLAERDGEVPQLIVNGTATDFTADVHGDFEMKQDIYETSSVDLKRDGVVIASWKIRVAADQAPQISLTETPAVTTRDNVKFRYTVKDDFGTVQVLARITPHVQPPEQATGAIEIPLSSLPASMDGTPHISLEDLTANPWSGSPVDVQLVAIDAAGHRTETIKQTVTLPERSFEHPVARALIEERKKLFQSPADVNVRNEVASLMAGIAQRPVAYNGDPVVLMALRSGAVRLVLDRKDDMRSEILGPVGDLLWQSALRIEYGKTGQAEQNLHHAQKDLSDALDRGASEIEVNVYLDRLHEALEDYLSALAMRRVTEPTAGKEATSPPVMRLNMLDKDDLEIKLQHVREDSADAGTARDDLAQFAYEVEATSIATHMMSARDATPNSDCIDLPAHLEDTRATQH